MSLERILFLLIALLLLALLGMAWALLSRLRGVAELRREIGMDLASPLERLERELRGAVQASGQSLRTEQAGQLAQFQQMLLNQQGESTRTQNAQLDTVALQLQSLQKAVGDTLVQQVGHLTQTNTQSLQTLQAQLVERLDALRQSTDKSLSEMRGTMELRLRELQADNEKKLEQMRATVDEKLHATLE
ncbi:MAG: recombinase RmuC, partial [Thiomonas sp. 20-64-5]